MARLRGADADPVLQALRPVVAGLAQTFGPGCEVVLHDFADPEHSIIEISGNLTDRGIGGSVTQIGLALFAKGDAATDQILWQDYQRHETKQPEKTLEFLQRMEAQLRIKA